MQQILNRVGARVAAEQDRRLARVELERLGARRVLTARGEKRPDRRAVVRPADPAVASTELELRQLRLRLDQIQRGEHLLGINAVAKRVSHCAHCMPSSRDAFRGMVLPGRVRDIGATTQILAGCT
jgi:hypothetical protein